MSKLRWGTCTGRVSSVLFFCVLIIISILVLMIVSGIWLGSKQRQRFLFQETVFGIMHLLSSRVAEISSSNASVLAGSFLLN